MSKDEIKEKIKAYYIGNDIDKVLDYITNLQQENKQLKERIDKAIEYINENWGHWCSNHYKYATETIEILGDKE